MTLLEKEGIKKRVRALWAEVFAQSSKVLRDSNIYPFSLMENMPDPNIHAIMAGLRIMIRYMDIIFDSIEESFLELDHTEMRRLFNARQQVLNMERVAMALKMDDEEAYEEALKAMEAQADF